MTRVYAEKGLLGCCQRTLIGFAKDDHLQGLGEEGDRLTCPDCKQPLVYRAPGWRRTRV